LLVFENIFFLSVIPSTSSKVSTTTVEDSILISTVILEETTTPTSSSQSLIISTISSTMDYAKSSEDTNSLSTTIVGSSLSGFYPFLYS
jgi:hypothetical protein